MGVRDYILQPMTAQGVRRRYTAFLCSLFTSGKNWLSKVDCGGVPLAEWWYNHLNTDVTESKPDPNRSKFYGEVVEGAEVRNSAASKPELLLENLIAEAI